MFTPPFLKFKFMNIIIVCIYGMYYITCTQPADYI